MRNCFRLHLHILSFLLVLTAVFAVGRHGATAYAAGVDRLYYFNMDMNGGTQGSLMLVESNGRWGLVDTGHRYADTIQDEDGRLISVPESLGLSSQISMRNGRDVANYMINRLGVTHLDFIVGTHAHSDHVGGVPEIATTAFTDANGNTRYLVDNNTTYYYKEYQHIANFEDDLATFSNTSWHNQAYAYQAAETMRNQGANLVDVSKQQVISGDPGNAYGDYITFTMGDMTFRLYNVYEQTNTGNENVNSIVTVLTNGDYTVVNLADIDTGNGAIDRTSEAISRDFGTVDIVVAGHHGYAGSNTKLMFDELQPDYVVISNGKGNDSYIYTKNDLAAAIPYAQDFFGTKFFSTAMTPYAIVTDLIGNQVYVYNLEGNGELTDAFYKAIKRSKTTGWVSWINTEGTLWTYLENGKPRRNSWKQDNGKWYYLGSDGIMQTGWIEADGERYLMMEDGSMYAGWLQQDGKWYYLNKGGENGTYGKLITGWAKINGQWYLFEENGVMKENTWYDGYYFNDKGWMLTGWQKLNGRWYYLNPEGGKAATGWQTINGQRYFFDEDGAMKENTWYDGYYFNDKGWMLTGWQRLNGRWYYLNPEGGKAVTGWQTINGKRYFFEDNGIMKENTWYEGRYFNDKGWMSSGWQQTDGRWYYLNPDSGLPATGWQTINGQRYYFAEDGTMTENDWYDGCYFNEKGWMVTGWMRLNNRWYYLNPEGGKAVTGWQTINGKRYFFADNGIMKENTWYEGRYFNDKGWMSSGWQQADGRWYYLDPDSGLPVTGWQTINGQRYYFAEDGTMTENDWYDGYYFNDKGWMVTGWQQKDGRWYYLNAETGRPVTGWQTINGQWYFFEEDGVMKENTLYDGYYFNEKGWMVTGWQRVNDRWYYMNPEGGQAVTGWQTINGQRYYFAEDGAMTENAWYDGYYFNDKGWMVTGWQWIGDQCYYFYDDGSLARDMFIDGYYVNGDGIWVQDAA